MNAIAGLVSFVLLAPALAFGQQVSIHPDESQSFDQRIGWALQTRDQDGFWIGYSISKFMYAGSWMGRVGGEGWASRKSLYALLGKPGMEEELPADLKRELGFISDGVIHINDAESRTLVLKEIGVLVYYEGREPTPAAIHTTSLSLGVELDGKNLYWLGKTSDDESTTYLKTIFEKGGEELKSDLLRTIAIHENKASNFSFISGIVGSDASEDLREDAVFWIGQMDLPQGLAFLKEVVANDRSMDVREKAVFSISQMKSEAALDELIHLVQNVTPRDVRKQAIFWLGQKASQKASALLEEIVYDEADLEVQEHAVHALAQMPAEKSIPKLIEIANNHPSVAVRKKAIFWLGDSGDPRVVEVLVQLARSAN